MITDQQREHYHFLFTQVQNNRNWKLPINKEIRITESEFDDMKKAIQFFTGSKNITIIPTSEFTAQITAEGYYNAIGD